MEWTNICDVLMSPISEQLVEGQWVRIIFLRAKGETQVGEKGRGEKTSDRIKIAKP